MSAPCMKLAMPGIRDLHMIPQEPHLPFHSVNKKLSQIARGTVQSQAPIYAAGEHGYKEEQAETYLGEKFWNFYTRVLGMKQLPRPPFPFDGAWLEAGGLTLHLIADDPTIPRKGACKHWKDQYNTDEPEPWYIRRGAHKAFAVASLADAEGRLKQFGIEFHKFLVPGTSASQIFLYDPEGNGIELGENYEDIAKSLLKK